MSTCECESVLPLKLTLTTQAARKCVGKWVCMRVCVVYTCACVHVCARV